MMGGMACVEGYGVGGMVWGVVLTYTCIMMSLCHSFSVFQVDKLFIIHFRLTQNNWKASSAEATVIRQ